MDITDRLPYIFVCIVILVALIVYKCGRDYRRHSAARQSDLMQLPHHKAE
jgi:hypothetical protein